MKILKLLTTDNKEIECILEHKELIYGAVAVVSQKHTNEKVIHPLTKEKLEVINIKGVAEPYLLIPAHIQSHFDIAKKYGLPVKQVVAPLFQGIGSQQIRLDKPIQIRHSVIAVVRHFADDAYLCVDSYGRVCKSFVLGGIEIDETPEEAALREIEEETGYIDIEIDHVYPIMLLNHFYADYKGVNRHATLQIVFCNLKSEKKQVISEKEGTEHAVKWISKKDLINFISVNNNQFVVDIINNGEHAYEGDGLMINSVELDGLTRNEAKAVITKRL